MKNGKRKIIAALAFITALVLLSSCDVFRLKYPGEREGKAAFREEDVDFCYLYRPEKPGNLTRGNYERKRRNA